MLIFQKTVLSIVKQIGHSTMTSSKLPKPKKKDKERQEKIAKNIDKEKIQLDQPQGLERFQKVIKQIGKKPQ